MLDSIEAIRDPKDDLTDLCLELEEVSLKSGEAKGRKKTYKVNTTTGPREICSWKFSEFAYSRDIKLPIRARGLFLEGERIAVRGYDKFFNINEVPATSMGYLKHLKGPFEVTMKENGCIVFVSGLEDGTLLVCSKHVTGSSIEEKADQSIFKHSDRAHEAVFSQLKEAGKSPAELAKVLYERNLTAVAELCDDEFEEHIIEYPKELAGLYLHGLNANTKEFKSYPMTEVYQLADEFGFKKVHVENFDTFGSLMQFLENAGKTGTFEGREIEGFVIRGKNKQGKTFFFKYKFDEPYAMYRTFREVTKKLISGHQKVDIILRQRRHQAIVQSYLDFVEPLFEEHPEMMEDYKREKGIIKVRNLYLQKMGLKANEGHGLIELASSQKLSHKLSEFLEETEYKYVLVPIAVVGCGKTTVFKTLRNVFEAWGHVQNDNCANAKKFRSSCMEAIGQSPVLLLDRNNFMKKERADIISSLSAERSTFIVPNVGLRFVAVNFTATPDTEKFSSTIRERVFARGDNHQSISAASESTKTERILSSMEARLNRPELIVADKEMEDVMDGKDYKSPDDEFAYIINIDITKQSSLDVAKKIWDFMSKQKEFQSIASPTEEVWQAAYEEALNYQPVTKKVVSSRLRNKRPEYYGVSIEEPEDLVAMMNNKVSGMETWKELKTRDRLQKKFHVTLGHKNSVHGSPSLQPKWNDLSRIFQMQEARKNSGDRTLVPVDYLADIQLLKVVVFDKKLAAVHVRITDCYQADGAPLTGTLEPLNEILHITLGTNKGVRPRESNIFLKELFTRYGEDVKDGEYQLKSTTARVRNFRNAFLKKQQVFIMYSFDY